MKNHRLQLSTDIVFLPEENVLIVSRDHGLITLHLEPQLGLLLSELVQHRGQVVTKKHFIEAIWEGNDLVGASALRKNIYKLRSILRDQGLNDEINIATVQKSGYKLVVKESAVIAQRSVSRQWYAYAVAAALLLILLMLRLGTEERIEEIEYTYEVPVVQSH